MAIPSAGQSPHFDDDGAIYIAIANSNSTSTIVVCVVFGRFYFRPFLLFKVFIFIWMKSCLDGEVASAVLFAAHSSHVMEVVVNKQKAHHHWWWVTSKILMYYLERDCCFSQYIYMKRKKKKKKPRHSLSLIPYELWSCFCHSNIIMLLLFEQTYAHHTPIQQTENIIQVAVCSLILYFCFLFVFFSLLLLLLLLWIIYTYGKEKSQTYKNMSAFECKINKAYAWYRCHGAHMHEPLALCLEKTCNELNVSDREWVEE